MNAVNIALSRRLRASPFESRSNIGIKAASVYNHIVLPTVYNSLQEDYWHLRENVQIWDVACQVQVEIKGIDALRLVQYLTPREISTCVPGQCMYAPLIDFRGGIINDPVILCLAEDRYWLSVSDSDVLFWVKGIATGMGFDVEICDPGAHPLSLQGPKSDTLLNRLIEKPATDIRFFRFIQTEIDGIEIYVARTGWSGQGGFELYLTDPTRGIQLWDFICSKGSDLNLRTGCPNLIDRIESGLLSFGNDMTLDNNPLEVGLDRFFKLGKQSEYLGREALETISRDGVSQRLIRVFCKDQELQNPRTTYRAQINDKDTVSCITSISYSPRLGGSVGFGFVPADMTAIGTEIRIETSGEEWLGKIADENWCTNSL